MKHVHHWKIDSPDGTEALTLRLRDGADISGRAEPALDGVAGRVDEAAKGAEAMSDRTARCKCPKGHPVEQEKDIETATTRFWKARINQVPVPFYTFRAHEFPCLRADEFVGVRLVSVAQ